MSTTRLPGDPEQPSTDPTSPDAPGGVCDVAESGTHAIGPVPTSGASEPAADVLLEGPSDEDIAFYKGRLAEWHEHAGEHVLVYEGQEHGFYPTRSAARSEGFRRFGPVAFLVKRVDLDEKPRPVTRVVL